MGLRLAMCLCSLRDRRAGPMKAKILTLRVCLFLRCDFYKWLFWEIAFQRLVKFSLRNGRSHCSDFNTINCMYHVASFKMRTEFLVPCFGIGIIRICLFDVQKSFAGISINSLQKKLASFVIVCRLWNPPGRKTGIRDLLHKLSLLVF